MTDFLWNTNDPIINNGRLVREGMFDHQRRWWNANSFYKTMSAGYGAGKTHVLCKRAIYSSLVNSGGFVLLLSASPTMSYYATRTTLLSLLEAKIDSTKGALSYRYNKSEKTVRVEWQGRIGMILCGDQTQKDRFKSCQLSAAYLDEAFIYDPDVEKMLVTRVRDPHATLREIGRVGTPSLTTPTFEIESNVVELKNEVVVAKTTDNLFIDKGYAERLRSRLSVPEYEVFVNGNLHVVN